MLEGGLQPVPQRGRRGGDRRDQAVLRGGKRGGNREQGREGGVRVFLLVDRSPGFKPKPPPLSTTGKQLDEKSGPSKQRRGGSPVRTHGGEKTSFRGKILTKMIDWRMYIRLFLQ